MQGVQSLYMRKEATHILSFNSGPYPTMDPQSELLKDCITGESTKSRRYSASYLTSFREEARSFRHAPTISSAASSPGYTSRGSINPSIHPFTEAIKALQTRSAKDSLSLIRRTSSEINPLHSKWDEAERYICNPFSGQVPLECLSARTLSGLADSKKNITVSAPLVFTHPRIILARSTTTHQEEPPNEGLESDKIGGSQRINTRRDVGTQCTAPTDLSLSTSNSCSDSAPPIKEISVENCRMEGDSLSSHGQPKGQGDEKVHSLQPIRKKGHFLINEKNKIDEYSCISVQKRSVVSSSRYSFCGNQKVAEGEQKQKGRKEKGREKKKVFKWKLGPCMAWDVLLKKQQKGEDACKK